MFQIFHLFFDLYVVLGFSQTLSRKTYDENLQGTTTPSITTPKNDTQHNDIQHNDIKHNDTRQNDIQDNKQ